jgi:hypothetical protein
LSRASTDSQIVEDVFLKVLVGHLEVSERIVGENWMRRSPFEVSAVAVVLELAAMRKRKIRRKEMKRLAS